MYWGRKSYLRLKYKLFSNDECLLSVPPDWSIPATRQDNMRLTTLFIGHRKRRRMNQSKRTTSRRSSRHWQLTLIDWPSFPPCLLIQYTAYKTCHWMNPSGERDREGSVHLLAVFKQLYIGEWIQMIIIPLSSQT